MRSLTLVVLVACTPIDPPDRPAAEVEPEVVVAVPRARAGDDVLMWQWTVKSAPKAERPWTTETMSVKAIDGEIVVVGDDDGGVHVRLEFAPAAWKTKVGTDFSNRGYAAVSHDAVYVAHYHSIATGAHVAKLDLVDGSIEWDVQLEGAGPISHSKYRNDVQVAVLGERVHAYGWESGGAYVEVLDSETGAKIDHTMVPSELVELPYKAPLSYDLGERGVAFPVGDDTHARLEDGERARLRLEGKKPGTIELPRGEGELGTGAGVMHDGTIYFAHASRISSGAWLYAIRPKDGAILWEKRLLGIGAVAHSQYLNELAIAIEHDAVVVYGNESYGQYLEVVDRETGATIVNKAWKPY